METRMVIVFCFLLFIGYTFTSADAFHRWYDAPRIYPLESETIVTASRNLTLRCEGTEPITWTFPNNTEEELESWSTVNVSTSITPDERFKYGALLNIVNVSYLDVGFYYCHGKDTQKDDPERSKSIYVYVRDEDHLRLGSDVQFVTVKQYANVTVPCIPTSPDITVTLKDSRGLEVPDIIAPYDSRHGFYVKVSKFSDNYECAYTRDGKLEEMTFYINVITSPDFVAKPHIEVLNNGRASIGEELTLNCTVQVEHNVFFTLSWHIPNEEEWKSGRIQASNTSAISGPNSKTGVSTLTIKNVTLEDEGVYICRIVDHVQNINNNSKFITVYEQNASFINITEDNDMYVLEEISGKDSVQWIINVQAHPIAQLMWFSNLNVEIMSGWTDSTNNKYEVKTSDTKAFLRINHITLSDAGVYRLVANNGRQQAMCNLTLIVSEKPTVEIQSDLYHKHEQQASLECISSGWPIPSIQWWFKPCLNDMCMFKPIPTQNYTTVTEKLRSVSYLNFFGHDSGYIKCFSNNSIGNDSNTIGFYVTDFSSGFDVWGIEEQSAVAAGDTVTVYCAVSVYNYTRDLQWFKINSNNSVPPEPIAKNDKYLIETSSTKYSYRLTLAIKNITHNDSGMYMCKAKSNEPELEDEENMRSLYINVKNPQKPRIIISNMNEPELNMKLGHPLKWYCEAVGVPTPFITWTKDQHDWSIGVNHTRVKLSQDNKNLSFTFTEADDEGTYTCKATNKVGSDYRSVKLGLIAGKGGLSKTLLTVTVFLATLFIIMVTVLVMKIRKEKKLRKELKIAGLMNFEKGGIESLNPDLAVDEQAELLPYDKKWELPRDKLKLGKQLGSGAFGVVMKAEAFGLIEGETQTTVAVKMVKRNADYTYIKALASELKIMVHLGKHLNVVNLLGACTKNVTKRELLVIVEYCRFGNLHNYLLRHREDFVNQIDPKTGLIDTYIGAEMLTRTLSVGSNQSATRSTVVAPADYRCSPNPSSCATGSTMVPTGDDCVILSNNSVQPEWRSNYRGDYKGNVRPISTHDLLCWAFQVARGMEYLASRKVLHGDLAARNILLAEDNIVKICDFGLAKSMYKSDNYKKKGDGPLPVKWMAVESIRDRVFSTQSDIWSFGIVLWEFFSLARTPYPGMDADERLYNKLVEGYRMDQPEYATKEIYQTMLDCWHAKPVYRPSFTKLADDLGDMLQESVRKHYIDLNDPYILMNNERLGEGHSDYLAMLSPPDYGNLASPSHEYVNSVPFQEEPTAETSGYLPMDIFSPRNNDVFDFELHKKQKSNGEEASGVELLPILHTNESDGEPSPTSPTKSFTNPNYQTQPTLNIEPKKETIVPTTDNYINMPQQKNAILNDKKQNVAGISNPNYVQMTNSNNVPNDNDTNKNYVNSQSRDWDRPYL